MGVGNQFKVYRQIASCSSLVPGEERTTSETIPCNRSQYPYFPHVPKTSPPPPFISTITVQHRGYVTKIWAMKYEDHVYPSAMQRIGGATQPSSAVQPHSSPLS